MKTPKNKVAKTMRMPPDAAVSKGKPSKSNKHSVHGMAKDHPHSVGKKHGKK